MILAVDDETRYLQSYIDELQYSGFETTVCQDVDSAAEFLSREGGTLQLCILDIMIPPGALFRGQDTRQGRRTGFLFFDYIRKSWPALPVVILTNVSSADVESKFGNLERCWWFRKDQCLPFEFAEHVRELLR